MEVVNYCPYCSSNIYETIETQKFEDVYLNIIDPTLNTYIREFRKCTECDLIYRNYSLSKSELNLLYKGAYRDDEFRSENGYEYFHRIDSIDNEESENYNKAIFLLSNINCVVKTILDVGCGAGLLIKKIKDERKGIKVYGVEPDLKYSEIARELSNADQIVTGFLKPNLFQEKFDAITCCDVFEHIEDPINFLNIIKDYLKVGGYLYVEIPSVNNFGKLRKDDEIFTYQHTYFYSNKFLYGLFEKCGFKVVLCEEIKYTRPTIKTRFIVKH